MVIKVELICIAFHFLIVFIAFLCNWFDLFAGSFLGRLNPLRLRWNTCQHLCLSLEITQFPVLQKTSPSGSVSAIVIQRIPPIIHHVCPLTFCITWPFFHFTWLLQWSRETEVYVYANVWTANRVYYGRCVMKNKLLNNSLRQTVTFWDLSAQSIDRRPCMYNKRPPWQRYTIK